ncbi:UDP-3-O-(3-hydroxymyristoyl)glucosamine N-acyltransferase [Candidatus Poribacteria bacterium]|nr:UDP-3-O-(3-hydroxymyristoyl)glucosamine N-acyltransferase [Candidatus Poribacteria bacterium]
MSDSTRAALAVGELFQRLGAPAPAGLPDFHISGVNTLEAAGPSEASFLTRRKFADQVAASRAGVILVSPKTAVADPRAVEVPDVWAAVVVLLNHFYPERAPNGRIHPAAIVPAGTVIGRNSQIDAYTVIEEGAVIGDDVWIGPHGTLGPGVRIGDGCRIHDRVTLASGTELGRRVILHTGCVIGADGFKYEVIGRRLTKIPQVGRVVIEDDVEMGANCTVDRASFSVTRVGARTKMDNAVHIGHNCDVGSDCVLVAQVALGGSTKVGRGVVMAGQVAVADNSVIGDGAKLGGKAGVHGTVPAGAEFVGTPARDARVQFRIWALEPKLPDLYAKLRPLLRQLEDDASEE